MIFALYREVLGSIAMYILVRINKLEVKVDREDYRLFLFLGFCSFCNVVGALFALDYMSATNFAILQPFIPVTTTVISYLVKYERLNMYKVWGIIVAVTGAVLIIVLGNADNDDEEENKNTVIGIIITLTSQVMFGSLIVFQRKLLVKYDPQVLTFVYYSIGSVITLFMCLCAAFRLKTGDLYLHNSLSSWLALGYAAIFATFLVYNLYSWVNRVLVSSVVTIYSTLQAVFTAIFEFMIYGEVLAVSQVFGGLLVAIGCALTVKGRLEETKEDDRIKGRSSVTDVKHSDQIGNADNNNGSHNSISFINDGIVDGLDTIEGIAAICNPLIENFKTDDGGCGYSQHGADADDSNNHSTLTL